MYLNGDHAFGITLLHHPVLILLQQRDVLLVLEVLLVLDLLEDLDLLAVDDLYLLLPAHLERHRLLLRRALRVVQRHVPDEIPLKERLV